MDKTIEKAYQDIFKVLDKYKDVINIDVESLKYKADCHLFGVELKEKYGLNIIPERIDKLDWHMFNDFVSIGKWGDKYRRTISWSVDGRQPENETLLQISFPTGAYIFGQDYPIKFFQEFWNELKTYTPKYIDEVNHCLYFSLENSADIFNNFNDILSKYRESNKEDYKRRNIEKMRAELEKLENS